jgi:hypothetical protein
VGLVDFRTVVAALGEPYRSDDDAVAALHRYDLDLKVPLRYRYGEGLGFAFQLALVRMLTPRPPRAYLLDVAPQTAYCAPGRVHRLGCHARASDRSRRHRDGNDDILTADDHDDASWTHDAGRWQTRPPGR